MRLGDPAITGDQWTVQTVGRADDQTVKWIYEHGQSVGFRNICPCERFDQEGS